MDQINDFLNEDEISQKIKNILETDDNIKNIVNSNDNFNDNNKFLHACKYCGNMCKGKQCKQCHFKMISRIHNCINCKTEFLALNCFNCQDHYNKHNLSTCPDCDETYTAFSKDGKFFDKCYKCNTTMFSKCQNCNKRCLKQYTYCKICFEKMINNNIDLPINICKTNECQNTTKYIFCKNCYKNYNFVNKNV